MSKLTGVEVNDAASHQRAKFVTYFRFDPYQPPMPAEIDRKNRRGKKPVQIDLPWVTIARGKASRGETLTRTVDIPIMATDEKSPNRPWYRPHLTTLIALAAVVSAVVYAQLDLRGGFGFGGAWHFTTSHYQGGPLICRHVIVEESVQWDSLPGAMTWETTTDVRWIASGLIVNIVASLLLISATVLVCERWRRRNFRPWQFSIRSMLLLITTVAVLLTLSRNEFSIYWWWSVTGFDVMNIFHGGLHYSPWYVIAPMALGIGCVVFAGCSIILDAGLFAFEKIIAKRPVTTHCIPRG